ncbi:hypothetical protein [Clostridium sp. D53t1_180928_C8]|uniref:hypothetical protein n=1 Tax=Clostridium sp. D53t1_180928_C8 TaxID=2787101 RepID=UPI0018A93067|nr:hypothetical protein [Clostridium sp. D53t1_180928_C8]
MEGFNWWGLFSFVIPIVLGIIVGAIAIVLSILEGINKILSSRSNLKGGEHSEKRKKRVA